MSRSSDVSLYLGLATATGTISAGAVALGLLHCTNARQRVASVGVLLFATVGIAASFETVARGRTSAIGNVLIGIGLLAAMGFVLIRALQKIFTEHPEAPAGEGVSGPPLPRLSDRSAGSPLHWQRRIAIGSFLGVLLAFAMVAERDLIGDAFESRPVGGTQATRVGNNDPGPMTWRIAHRRSGSLTQIGGITVRDVPAGATVELRCSGPDCKRARRRFSLGRAAEVSLVTELRRIVRVRTGAPITLHPATKIEIRVTTLLFTGKGVDIEIRRSGPPGYRKV